MCLFIVTVLIVGVTIAEIVVADKLKKVDTKLVNELQIQNQLLREQNKYLWALSDISEKNGNEVE